MIAFTVNSVPVAQPRQRHRTIATGSKTFTQNYTPTTHPVNVFKAACQNAAAKALPAPLDGPLMVWLVFVLPRPSTKTTKRGPNPRLWKAGKPDIDNLIKSIHDALNGIAWIDDSQVSWINAQKIIGAPDESPRVEIRIEQSAMPSLA